VTRRLASPAPKNKRDRVLTDEELVAVWYAARDIGYPYGDMIRLLLVTGQRRSEVARLRSEDLALAKATWNVNPHNKSSRPYQVPLPPLTLKILEAVPMRDQALVFGAPNAPDKEFSAWSKNKVRLDKLSGVSDFVVHDLRRTAGTNLVRLGVHPHVRERVLNHVIPGVEGVYDRHSWFNEKRDWFNEKRDALNTYDAFLRGLLAS
jgi:integrase